MKINKYITSFGLFVALLSCNKDNEPKPDNDIQITQNKTTSEDKAKITINVDEFIKINTVEYKLNNSNLLNIDVSTEVIKSLTENVQKAEIIVSINKKLKEKGATQYTKTITIDQVKKFDYEIKAGKEEKYFVSAIITDKNGDRHYGTETEYKVPTTIDKDQRIAKIKSTMIIGRNTSMVLYSPAVFIGEKPTEFIVEYSKKSDFSGSVKKKINDQINSGEFAVMLSIDKLDPASKYYLRFTTTFADGKTSTSDVTSFETTNKYKIGQIYGIDGNTYAQFLVFSTNPSTQTGKVVRIQNATSSDDWKKGNVDIVIKGKTYALSRPSVKDLEELKNVEDTDSKYWLGLSTTLFSEKLEDKFYATSEEDPTDSSKTIEYNPFTKKSRSVAKKLASGTRNERYILEVK
ncbi:hypothetical protein [Flammeovirga kamogawensis]|uniref:DUF4249 domain-containing protein n=1 Tax=Flammeovirga kamogawensis TaxID=373891 RepID=A0ABX8H474_9BACT|nr:hypothetical protein [Flammeovirga kamogawensis]MBB6461773.1 hypothetical protein [Flammeovirga kamogawensis]QWG10689.1 hypothetical protein KM029_25230 [Flammeovirga kamogawensis]TRX63792.1 hypothetical protein EO216_25605 [Flammeovirga kamogawensis]